VVNLEISVLEQTSVFFFAIVMGGVISTFYDIIKILRITFKFDKVKIFFFDMGYFFVSGIVTFLFIIAFNNGEIRFYVIVGEIIGFYLYRLLAGNTVVKYVCRFLRFLKAILSPIVIFLKVKIKNISLFLIKPITTLLDKFLFNAKKNLRISKKMLYNSTNGVSSNHRKRFNSIKFAKINALFKFKVPPKAKK
jgi:spore cortex biosynthesis protein YabQ